MPSSNRQYAEWTIERIGREAAATGPSIAKLTELTLESGGRIPRSPRHLAPGAGLRASLTTDSGAAAAGIADHGSDRPFDAACGSRRPPAIGREFSYDLVTEAPAGRGRSAPGSIGGRRWAGVPARAPRPRTAVQARAGQDAARKGSAVHEASTGGAATKLSCLSLRFASGRPSRVSRAGGGYPLWPNRRCGERGLDPARSRGLDKAGATCCDTDLPWHRSGPDGYHRLPGPRV